MLKLSVQRKATLKTKIILFSYSATIVSFSLFFILQLTNYGINYGRKRPLTYFFGFYEYIDFNSPGLSTFFDHFFTIIYIVGLIGLTLPILVVYTKKEFKQFNRITALILMFVYLIFAAVFNPLTFFYFTQSDLMDIPILKIVLIPEILFCFALIFLSFAYKADFSWKFHKLFFYWGCGSFVFFIFRATIPAVSGYLNAVVQFEFWLETFTMVTIIAFIVPIAYSAYKGEIAENFKTEDYKEFKDEVQQVLSETVEDIDWITEDIPKPEEYRSFRNYGLEEEEKKKEEEEEENERKKEKWREQY